MWAGSAALASPSLLSWFGEHDPTPSRWPPAAVIAGNASGKARRQRRPTGGAPPILVAVGGLGIRSTGGSMGSAWTAVMPRLALVFSERALIGRRDQELISRHHGLPARSRHGLSSGCSEADRWVARAHPAPRAALRPGRTGLRLPTECNFIYPESHVQAPVSSWVRHRK